MKKKPYARPEISREEELQRQLFEANLSLQAANERLEQEQCQRTALFANLSHDLRAPISALSNGVEYLKTGKAAGKEQEEILNLMEKRLRFLQRMVEDMFLLSKMESGDYALHRQKLEAAAFLEEYFYSCQADSAYDERTLALELQSGLDCPLSIDPELMVRVLDNLFSNARKYSGPGASITLSARRMGPWLEISVADTGMGISPEALPHLFERSYRASQARTPGDDSSGLGLAIARSILRRHGGDIRCQSTPGTGSVFTMTLPLAEEEPDVGQRHQPRPKNTTPD